jgi:hypothetical protein
LAFISVTLTFFILINLYNAVHRLWRIHGIYHGDAEQSPSFLQGPASSLLVFVAIVHMPSALITLIAAYHPDANFDAIEWPLAWWIFFINLFGSYFATRTGYNVKRANETNSALQLQLTNEGQEIERSSRTVPVDLAAVIGLFWATLAVAAGTGSVDWGPVMVIGYIGALWQALALFGGLGESSFPCLVPRPALTIISLRIHNLTGSRMEFHNAISGLVSRHAITLSLLSSTVFIRQRYC